MKKVYRLFQIVILLFIGFGSAFADGMQSFKIDNQTGVFVVKFTASPSTAMMNGAVGLSGVAVTGFPDYNCAIRFGSTGIIEVRNGAAYAALATYQYSAGHRYFFSMTVDVPNRKYSVVVHEQEGGPQVTLATDYAFRIDNFTGSLNYFNESVVDGTNQQYVGLSDFSIGTSTLFTEANYNIPTPTLTGDFGVKFSASPSHLPINAVAGMSDIVASQYGDLGPIIQFAADSTIKVRNSGAYAADFKVKYVAGGKYMFYITGNTTTHTYSVRVATPDKQIVKLATNYGFRKLANSLQYVTTMLNFDPVYSGKPGSYLAIDGLIAGTLGYDGDVHPSVSKSIGTNTTEITKTFVVTPSSNKVNAAVGLNKKAGIAWSDFNTIVNFIADDSIQVRDGAAYKKIPGISYQGGDSYIVGITANPATTKYKVTIDKGLYSAPVEVATDFGFRLNSPGDELDYLTSKDTWLAGTEGTYLTVNDVAIKMPPLMKAGANAAPTIAPVANQSCFSDSKPIEIALSGITYGGDPTVQTLAVTAVSSNPSIATAALDYVAGSSTGKLTITPKAAGQTTITIKVKDNGGIELGGIDTALVLVKVDVAAAQQIQNYTITTADGKWGADNQIMSGNDGVGFYEAWRQINRGVSPGTGNDGICVTNVMSNFTYSFYLRFDLNNLPDLGSCTDAKLKVFSHTATLGYTGVNIPHAVDSLVLYALKDGYAAGPDFEGYVPELDEFYEEGSQFGGWTSVLNATNKYVAGYEKYICADNAPGYNEGNSEDDIKATDWSYFNTTDALTKIGTKYTVALGDTTLLVNVADLKKVINEDTNNAIVFVLAKIPTRSTSPTNAQNLFKGTAFSVYTGENKGMEPRLELTWDKGPSAVEKINNRNGEVSVYPNPATNMLKVNYPSNSSKIEIYSVTGVKLAEYNSLNTNSSMINISELNSGLFFLKVLNDKNHDIETVKFFKK